MLLLICAERREWLTERGASSSEEDAAAAEVHLSGPSKVSTAASGKEEVLFIAGGMNRGGNCKKLLQLSGFDLDESAGVCLFI